MAVYIVAGFMARPRCSQRERLEGEDAEGAKEVYLDCTFDLFPVPFNPFDAGFFRTGCSDAGLSLNAYSLIVSLVFFRLDPKYFFGGGEGFDNSFSFVVAARPFVWLLLVPFKQLGPAFKGVFLTFVLTGEIEILVSEGAYDTLDWNNRESDDLEVCGREKAFWDFLAALNFLGII